MTRVEEVLESMGYEVTGDICDRVFLPIEEDSIKRKHGVGFQLQSNSL